MPKMWVITRETQVELIRYKDEDKLDKGSFDDLEAAKKAIKNDDKYDSKDVIVTVEE